MPLPKNWENAILTATCLTPSVNASLSIFNWIFKPFFVSGVLNAS